MNLAQYLTEKLTADGFTGIAGDECGCLLGVYDIAPCDDLHIGDCHPGYVHDCIECPRRPDAGDDCPLERGSLYCVSTSRDWPSAQDVE